MIDQRIVDILGCLNLDNVTTVQELIIYCCPKINDNEFKEKFELAKNQVKKISKNVKLRMVEEGEIISCQIT